jgi:hypothetical protein
MTLSTDPARAPADPLAQLWKLASGNMLLAGVCGLWSLTLAAAALIPQQPLGLSEAAGQRWITSAESQFGPSGSALTAIGAFDITGGQWVRGLLLLTIYLLLIRLARLVHEWRHPVLPAGPSRLKRVEAAIPGDLSTAADQVLGALSGSFTRVVAATNSIHALLLPRLSELWPSLMITVGVVFLLTAVWLEPLTGWRVAEITLSSGALQPLDPIGSVVLQAAPVQNSSAAMAISVTLPAGNQVLALLQPGRPVRVGTLWLAERSTGTALGVTCKNRAGAPIILQAQGANGEAGAGLHLLFTPTQTEQAFAIPSSNLGFRVVDYPALPDRGIDRPVFLVQALRGDVAAPVFEQLVTDGGEYDIDDITISFQRDRYTTLSVSYLPALWLFAAGIFLLLIGIEARMFTGRQRAWLTFWVDGDQTRLSATMSWTMRRQVEQAIAGSLASATDSCTTSPEEGADVA